MSPPSRQDVLAEIARRFPPEARTAVVKALNFYGARPSEPERERVQLAILERSAGDADKLRLLVEQAKKDYRSVLVGAAWCRRIAWDLDRPRHARVVACAGVTLGCYAVIALVLSGLALV